MRANKIYKRLLMSFALVVVLALALGIFAIVVASVESEKTKDMYDTYVIGLGYLNKTGANLDDMRISVEKSLSSALLGDFAAVNTHRNNFEQAKNILNENLAKSEPLIISPDLKIKLTNLTASKDRYIKASNEFIDYLSLMTSAQTKDIIYSRSAILSNEEAVLEEILDELISGSLSEADKLTADADLFRFIAIIVSVALMIIIVVSFIVLALLVSNGMVKNLTSVISTLMVSTTNIGSSAVQLSDAAESLAIGSSRQAASIEETSATMNETSSMISQNAENTRIAAQIAIEAQQAIAYLGKQISELMHTIVELKESSDKVSKIVKVIDDIAFQTNLLAINATVEAARTGGDAGRSFAVVAQEVRNLAQKSASNSSESADIIARNIMLTDASKKIADKVMEITQKGTQQIGALEKLISEISAASEEQASGVKQINIAVSQMEKITQENAAVAEENAAASNSMKDEITHLDEVIGVAKNMIRNSEPTSSAKEIQSLNHYNHLSVLQLQNRPKNTNISSTSRTTTASRNSLASSSNSLNSSKSDAEKIIPLDDNDDF